MKMTTNVFEKMVLGTNRKMNTDMHEKNDNNKINKIRRKKSDTCMKMTKVRRLDCSLNVIMPRKHPIKLSIF